MKTKTYHQHSRRQKESAGNENRAKLLKNLPVSEYRETYAGVNSAILVGGEGPPVILLHGPGESSLWWMRVIPKLVSTNQVIAPDFPGHGASSVDIKSLDANLVFEWLREIVNHWCSTPPVLVGHSLGGSIAARFAVNHGDLLHKLVLVDSLGLGKFRPTPAFAYRLVRFIIRPTRKNYSRFLPQCMYNVEKLRQDMGTDWTPFLEYNLDRAHNPDVKSAMRILMKQLGVPKISETNLKQIEIPISLIWGRHDRAIKLEIAEEASERYGWPLHVIDKTRDDPKLEQPEAFTNALYRELNVAKSHANFN